MPRPKGYPATSIDRTGQRYGLITMHWPVGRTRAGIMWLASCDCGSLSIVNPSNLVTGHTKSCGCMRGTYLIHPVKHGHSGSETASQSPEYTTWVGMIQRCHNPRATSFANYGGRGIKVCDRWRDFELFLLDMGRRPEGKSIDRFPNPGGHYEPGNCRWATPMEQRHNRRMA